MLSFNCLCNTLFGHALYFGSLFNDPTLTKEGEDVVDTEDDSHVDNVGSELVLDEVGKNRTLLFDLDRCGFISSTSATDD